MKKYFYSGAAALLTSCLLNSGACAMEGAEGGFWTKAFNKVRAVVSPSAVGDDILLWESIEKAAKAAGEDLKSRVGFTQQWGHSVPSKKAVQAMWEFIGEEKCLEVGSRLGLWAYLLQQARVDILATDENPPEEGAGFVWGIKKLTAEEALSQHPDRTVLFLNWWPLKDGVWKKSIPNPTDLFKGNKIIHIGENEENGGAGWPKSAEWKVKQTIEIPQLYGSQDQITFFVRKTRKIPHSKAKP